MTDDTKKILKMQHIFAYNVMLRLTIFEIFAVKWLFTGQKPTPSPFLDSHLIRILRPLKILPPKDKATSRELYYHAKFHADRLHHCRDLISADLLSDKMYTSIAFAV